jgi:nucleoid DNA-binding protein
MIINSSFEKDFIEFYETIGYKFNLSYSIVRNICESPFNLLKKEFDSGELNDVKIKHLGKFEIKKSRLISIRNDLMKNKNFIYLSEQKRQTVIERINKELKEKYDL